MEKRRILKIDQIIYQLNVHSKKTTHFLPLINTISEKFFGVKGLIKTFLLRSLPFLLFYFFIVFDTAVAT